MSVSKPLFIKKLRLHGFKAFGEPTTLDLESGIVAFAGPNGCGKSNLVDAIRWVMGEQRSSDLRSNRLEDLIFHGSSKSRQSNYAEVSITLNNSEKIINTTFPHVTLARRVYRSGESECFINKAPCRLRDMTELLSSFIGKSGHCIVAQGKVEEIASSNPEVKRKILEEVAGVDRFREKNREYERQIKESRTNLDRLSDILRSMRKQEQILKRQAEECKEFFQLKKDLTTFEVKNAVFNFWELGAKTEDLRKILAEIEQKKQQENNALNQQNEEGKKLKEFLTENQNVISQLEKQQIESSSKENILLEKANIRLKLTELNKNRLEEIDQEIKNIDLQRDAINKRIAEAEQKKSALHQEVEKIVQDIAQIKKMSEELTENLQFLEKSQSEKKQKIVLLKGEVQNHKKEIAGTTEAILVKLRRIANHDVLSDLSQQNEQKKIETLEQEEKNLIVAINDLRQSVSVVDEKQKMIVFVDRLDGLLQSFIENNLNFRKSISNEMKGFKEVLSEYEKRKELINVIEQKEKNIDALGLQIIEDSQEREKISKKIYDVKTQIYRLDTDKRSSLSKAQENESSLKRYGNEIIHLKKRMEKSHEGQQNCLKELEKLEIEEKSIKEQKMTDIFKDKKIEAQLKEQKQKQKQNVDVLRDLELKIDRGTRSSQSLKDQMVSHQTKIGLLENDISHLQKNVMEVHRVNLLEESEKISSKKSSFFNEMEKLKQEIFALRQKVERKSKINPLALDEYEEIKKQIEVFVKEKDDVESSMLDLKKLSDALKKNSGEAFLESFAKVNQSFSSLISELFAGGRGELRLHNIDGGEDISPLEAGVEIRVEPKGKKMQRIDLFSGGEKTLIAVAFLFSLFLVRRTPFCIFDEVDAALDNENVLRFMKMLKKYEDKIQFIIISHNQNTFSIVDYVYGVSMQDGISSLFSLKMPN